MFTDGQVHDLDYFIDQYTEITVTEDNFESEKAAGIYYYTGALNITANTEQIEYFYYSDDDFTQTYDHETIPVIRDGTSIIEVRTYFSRTSDTNKPTEWFATPPEFFGENKYLWQYEVTVFSDGTQSQTEPSIISQTENAPIYKGAFTSNNIPKGIIDGDTYLNLTDKHVYRYNRYQDRWLVLSDNSPEWWAAMGDAINYVAETGIEIEAANIWAAKIVAGTILADAIMAKSLIFKNTFQSQNWNGGATHTAGTRGIFMDKNGNAAFMGDTRIGGKLVVDGTDTEIKNARIGGLIQQGLKTFTLFKIFMLYENPYIYILNTTLPLTNITMTNDSVVSNMLQIRRMTRGIYRFRLLRSKMMELFPVLWDSKTEWSYVQLVPNVRLASDEVYKKNYNGSEYLISDSTYNVNVQIKAECNANDQNYTTQDSYENATGEVLKMNNSWIPFPVNSWVLKSGWYEFYVLCHDNNQDNFQDVYGGLDMTITGYFYD